MDSGLHPGLADEGREAGPTAETWSLGQRQRCHTCVEAQRAYGEKSDDGQELDRARNGALFTVAVVRLLLSLPKPFRSGPEQHDFDDKRQHDEQIYDHQKFHRYASLRALGFSWSVAGAVSYCQRLPLHRHVLPEATIFALSVPLFCLTYLAGADSFSYSLSARFQWGRRSWLFSVG